MVRPEMAASLEHHRRAPCRHTAWTSLRSFALALFVAGSGSIRVGTAEAQRPLPEDVEAAYLYNFGKFVRWPENGRSGPLLICVAGQDSFEETVARLVQDERINDRPLEVRLLRRGDKEQGCSILFIGAAERDHLDGLLAEAVGKPILTVSDVPDFLARGGVIQFLFLENHVRFSVNLNAANRNGLDLSSELLKVAVSVTGRPQNGAAQ